MKSIHAQITKVDEEKRLVYGVAAAEVADRSGEILDYATSKAHFENWVKETLEASDGQSHGNLRAMHGKVAAGKLTGIEFDDINKQFPVVAKVVDDNEWKKVLEGVYTGFSIGGAYVKKWDDPTAKKSDGSKLVRYTAAPNELSLVDRPCIPAAKFFDIQKADGALMKAEFQAVLKDEDIEAKARELCKTDGFEPDTIDETDKENPQPLWKAYTDIASDALLNPTAEDVQPVEYQVEGSDEEVSKLAEIMNTEQLSMGDVLVFVGKGLDARAIELASTAVLKSEADGALRKGMYAVSRLAELLQSLQNLSANVVNEEAAEGDYSSVLPARMQSLVQAACATLQDMVTEEVAEITGTRDAAELATAEVALADKAGGMEKIAGHDKAAALDNVRKLHALLADMLPATEEPAPIVKVEDADLQKIASMEKMLATLADQQTQLLAKIAKLEAEPAKPRSILRAVSKSADMVEEAEENVIQPVVNKRDGQINEAASLIKAAHKSGGVQAGLRLDGTSVFNKQ